MIESLRKYLETKSIVLTKHGETYLYTFSYRDRVYVVEYQAQDPYYLRLMFLINKEDILDQLPSKLNDIFELNSRYKVAKIITMENHIGVSIEQFIYGKNTQCDLNDLFDRLLNLLEIVTKEFVALISNEDGEAKQ